MLPQMTEKQLVLIRESVHAVMPASPHEMVNPAQLMFQAVSIAIVEAEMRLLFCAESEHEEWVAFIEAGKEVLKSIEGGDF